MNTVISVSARRYVLFMLMLIYTLNFIDRQILSILLPSIQLELAINDTQAGFLVGFAFALFYATLGMPIGLYADRSNRRNLISLALVVWSGMTALCGLAQNFVQLAIARIGVGIGEAGCSPPAHSLLSDYYPPEKRATALSIYSLGIPLGIMFGLFIGGWIDQWLGWRYALFIVGLPGILVALIFRFTVAEPVRGSADNLQQQRNPPTVGETIVFLWRRPTFIHLAVGAGLAAFSGYASVAWSPTFLARSHAMSSGEIGTWLGLIAGLPGALGVFLGGYLADRIGRNDDRWRLWVIPPAFILAAPFLILTYISGAKAIVLSSMCVTAVLSNFFIATSFAQTQNISAVRIRSVAAAIMLFIINMIGLGIGPWATGFASHLLSPYFGQDSLRYALLIVSSIYIWSGFHFYWAGKYLPTDIKRVGELTTV